MKEKIDEAIKYLTMGKRYLKHEYKSNCVANKGSEIPDHCCPFAFSNPTEKLFRKICKHQQKKKWQRLPIWNQWQFSAINDMLESCDVSVLQNDPENHVMEIMKGRGMKCHVCIKNLQGMKDEQRHWQKCNLKRMKKNCKNCKKATFPKYHSTNHFFYFCLFWIHFC